MGCATPPLGDGVSGSSTPDVPAALGEGAASPEPPAPPRPASPKQPVTLELDASGVSTLYQGFFQDVDALSKLREALEPCASGRVVLVVDWNEPKLQGTIRLVFEDGALRCTPRASPSAVDLSPLVPVAQALAAFRDHMGMRYDVRLASFRVALQGREARTLCEVLAHGQHPPDGSSFSPCVSLDGVAACERAPSEGVLSVSFPGKQAARFARCFGD